ncbi:uncharacterized protein LOC124292988 [Neodiprion lecontei]|uniref:Uncharacterized protein LOC124292988 n=1 Tax=Neodiprion lecontei TaxID=441921 RepID=A0ABM3FIJ8_NEOLC|nr:uncharacterized protein LOC124292988 [Neodiprion lecontei]
MPDITEILDKLGSAKYFSTFDLASGFHQIPMHPDHSTKTAFSTPRGHYEFSRMPFGLKNAPATIQRLMDQVHLGLQERLTAAGLTLQPDKCEFLRKEVVYLGHLMTESGVKPDPGKLIAVKEYPVPKNPKNVRQFLGLLGAVLSQDKDGPDLPVAYASRALNPAELNYSVPNKEFLAAHWSMNHFRPYIHGQKFILITDHEPLEWVKSVKKPHSRLLRWSLELAEYDFDTEYKSGKSNINADALYRDAPPDTAQMLSIDTKRPRPTTEAPGGRSKKRSKKTHQYPRRPRQTTDESTNPTPLKHFKISRPRTDDFGPPTDLPGPFYSDFLIESETSPLMRNRRIEEIKADPSQQKDNLAHCISADYQMSKGIASELTERKFINREQLREFDTTVIDVISVVHGNRKIYNLVTKPKYSDKPLPHVFFDTLVNFRKTLHEDGVTSSPIPLIGCGLDKIEWSVVRKMIHYVFKNSKSNESLERSHLVLTEHIKHYTDADKDWDDYIRSAIFCYNTAKHEGTNFTLHQLIFGFEARLPTDANPASAYTCSYDPFLLDLTATLSSIRKHAASNLQQAKHRFKTYYDRNVNSQNFKAGQRSIY